MKNPSMRVFITKINRHGQTQESVVRCFEFEKPQGLWFLIKRGVFYKRRNVFCDYLTTCWCSPRRATCKGALAPLTGCRWLPLWIMITSAKGDCQMLRLVAVFRPFCRTLVASTGSCFARLGCCCSTLVKLAPESRLSHSPLPPPPRGGRGRG